MKEVKKRKAQLPEFKVKVGLEALRGEKTVNQIGQECGVHPVQVGQWRKEIQAQAKIAVRLDPLHRTARRSGIEPVAAWEPPRNPGRCIVNFCFLGEF